jgi:hypothetical protein
VGSVPVVGGVVSGATGGGSATGGVLAPVTNIVGSVPVVGGVVSGLTGGSGGSSTPLLGGLLHR